MMIWMWFNYDFRLNNLQHVQSHLLDNNIISTIARTKHGCIAAYFPTAQEHDIGKPERFTLSRVS